MQSFSYALQTQSWKRSLESLIRFFVSFLQDSHCKHHLFTTLGIRIQVKRSSYMMLWYLNWEKLSSNTLILTQNVSTNKSLDNRPRTIAFVVDTLIDMFRSRRDFLIRGPGQFTWNPFYHVKIVPFFQGRFAFYRCRKLAHYCFQYAKARFWNTVLEGRYLN